MAEVRTPIDPNQIGPVSAFDAHLKVLSESYIGFFQERLRAEEAYVESLQRIHTRWKAVDSLHDDRGTTTSRRAWREVRDGLERETDARAAFANCLRMDVLSPLVALKETQERTRKRIKEDLRTSIIAHAQFAENELPKMKRNYLKKCQEVDEYKAAPAGPSFTTAPQMAPPPEPAPSTAQRGQPQPITSPVPLRPATRIPSGGPQPTTRNRSPSGSSSLSDLAHQGDSKSHTSPSGLSFRTGKKQFNQLITFLGDGKERSVRESFGGKGDGPLRTVKAKREADEADKEYRKGVHWLETLRINRIKILEGGYKSLELFIHESTERLKGALESYIDGITATSATTTQLSQHVRNSVATISPDKDTLAVTSHSARSLALATPRPTLYYNYHVGECKDLIFGVSLVDYATARAVPDGEIPKVVKLSVTEIERRGLDSEGLYRISGRHANVQEITQRIERDESRFAYNPVNDDVYSISSTLKLYLRELPEPVFRFPLQERLQYTEDRESHLANGFRVLKSKIRRLAPIHQATLRTIAEHLHRVAANCEKNKMDTKNLAIVFGAVIFGEDEMPKNGDILSIQSWKDSLMEDLIAHCGQLFDDAPMEHGNILPPAPPNEPPAPREYGSSFTQIATLPSKTSTNNRDSSGDFTPQLPPWPEGSIHPSRRAHKSGLEVGLEPAVEVTLAQRVEQQLPAPPEQETISSPTSPPQSEGHGAPETSDAVSVATTVVEAHAQQH